MDELLKPFARAAYSGHVKKVEDLKRWQHLSDDEIEVYGSIAESVLETARTQYFNDLKRRADKVNTIRGDQADKREIIILLVVNLERYLQGRVESLAPEKMEKWKERRKRPGLEDCHRILMSIRYRYAEDINRHRCIKKAIEKLYDHRDAAAHGDVITLPREKIKPIIEAIEDLMTVKIGPIVITSGVPTARLDLKYTPPSSK